MAYRIRYEVRRMDRKWLLLAAAAGAAVLLWTQEHWYPELAAYVGAEIRGAG